MVSDYANMSLDNRYKMKEIEKESKYFLIYYNWILKRWVQGTSWNKNSAILNSIQFQPQIFEATP